MLTVDRQPKVIDFGLAKNTDPGGPRPTRVGTVMGTPHYMPLEQLRGEVDAIGPASDVYSLGVVLYRLLAGRLPYPGHEFEELLANLLTRTPPSPCEFQPDLEPDLAAIVLKAITRDREDRYTSMKDFANALAAFQRASEAGASEASWKGLNRDATTSGGGRSGLRTRRGLLLAGALGGACILLGAIIISITNRDGTRTTIAVPEGVDLKLQTAPGATVSIGPGEAAADLPSTMSSVSDNRELPLAVANSARASESASVEIAVPQTGQSADRATAFEALVRDGNLVPEGTQILSDLSDRPAWVSEDGLLRCIKEGDKLLTFGHREYQNLELICEYQLSGDRGAAFVFRSQWRGERPTGFCVGLGKAGPGAHSFGAIYRWSYKSGDIAALHSGNPGLGPSPGEWGRLRVVVRDGSVQIESDGRPVSETRLPTQLYPTGHVGFICSGDSSLTLRNAEIRELPGSKMPRDELPAVVSGDPAEVRTLKDTLLNYEWNYFDSKYPPGDSCRFYENGEFHKRKWNYWVVGPRTVHIQYGDPAYKPESAIVFSVNEDLSELKGSFGEGKNRITITRLNPLKPEVAADSSEPRLFNGDWKI
jgi:hypothetical protein